MDAGALRGARRCALPSAVFLGDRPCGRKRRTLKGACRHDEISRSSVAPPPLALTPGRRRARGRRPAPGRPSRRSIPPCSRGLKWREVGPFRGGRVAAVAGVPGDRTPSTSARTGGGVWKTTDGGAHLGERLGRLLRRLGRRGRRLRVRPERRLRRQGRGDDPRQRLARRRRLQVDRRRQDLDSTRPRRRRGTSPRIRVHPQEPRPRLRRGARPRLRPERGARRLPLAGRRRDAGSASSSSATTPAPSTSRWTRPTRASSTPRSGRCRRTPCSLESGGPGSGALEVDRRRRHLDGADAQPRPAEGDARQDRRRRLAREPAERVWAIVEAEEGGVFRSTTAARPGRRPATTATCASAPGTTAASIADPKDADDGLRRSTSSFDRSTDGGKTFSRDPHAARRQPRPLDRPRRPAADDRGQRRRRERLAPTAARPGRTIDNQPTAQFYHVIDRQPRPLPRLRRAAGQLGRCASASRSAAAASARGDWDDDGGRRERLHRRRPDEPGRRLRRLLRRPAHPATTTRTGENRDVNVWPDNPMGCGAAELKYRFQWTFPIVFSPHDPNTLYAAGPACCSRRTDERRRAGRRSAPT